MSKGMKSSNSKNKKSDFDNDTSLDPSSRDFIYDDVDDFVDSQEEANLREVTFKKPKKIDSVSNFI